jgi:hypothetical protein
LKFFSTYLSFTSSSFQTTFSLFSPIGIAIGIALTETVSREEEVQSPTVIALQGVATGTLLYVVFFELLEKERARKGVNSLIQVREIDSLALCALGPG